MPDRTPEQRRWGRRPIRTPEPPSPLGSWWAEPQAQADRGAFMDTARQRFEAYRLERAIYRVPEWES